MEIPRLHPDTIEEVKLRADIVDVVSEYVVLRKRGKDFVGLCPFHDEKSPSFTVSPSKQMFYCFGCQAGGNAIKFVMDLGKRHFTEVVLDLARRYQVPVQTLEPEQKQELQRQLSLREQLYEVLASTAQFYQHALRHTQQQKVMQYLRENRQLREETIQQFGLGYAPAGWETLHRYLVEDKHYPVQLVEKAGLIKPRKEGGGYYDVFRDRLMIPIRDVQGRVIAFGGRTLTEEQPKYLNSPETELFSKGKTLFALDQAKDGIAKLDQAVVVEGYFDAIALHAAGINNAVASLGTALSIEQVRLLLRYTDSKQLILNFDADKAGTNAAERAIGEIATLAYKGEVQLKILNLPNGKDADEYLQSHTSADYQQLLATAPLWLNWQIDQIIQNRDLRQATDFQQVTQQIVKLLQNIVNGDTLNYYISYCAEILSLGDSRIIPLRVENLLTQIAPASVQTPPSRFRKQESKTPKLSLVNTERSLLEQAEALLLQIYLHCPEQRQLIINELEERNLELSLTHHRFLWLQISELTDEADLISNLQNRYLELSEELGLISHLFHLNEKTNKEILRTPQVVQATLACMEIVLREKRYRHFMELWENIDIQAEPDKYKSYADAIYAEKMRIQELDKQRQFPITELL
ncbi:DNA primase [Anabaena cylindrica FACHB-243]|uniref:DNA primase n=1 Tax=Anabaena cylindrica (strain ATCC 27899 / PCC 7122) TaxID=272123 RepID=K9ZIL8_ANACC|nr:MULTISPECIES: DNA primase [Anabaena]AFZ59078.1 DNA primase [Anabaena cylindrica PCC 7122]MBD2420583.1 DNA primase [Anabaena cylindrica FACHB-243]MBY5284448.1 DNA primase [Anabaena sp. CCAP 1446/1C]MBY5308987.1 DNA primase [Anabaena sp. CCAP 1446/1C]MCM2408541.1 DNA primase [Anabaena sp. CCAP 1446/1C]